MARTKSPHDANTCREPGCPECEIATNRKKLLDLARAQKPPTGAIKRAAVDLLRGPNPNPAFGQ